ncbi:MAG: acetyl-CoA carboxylase biotin carboxyl carrier protein [Flavobacteriales bacterium]|nr:acetyl-CoA carboxylase biotin carboxyl carrier protein [Flavobacteriales bacterium]
MDLKEIQNLIRFVSKSDVAEVKYKSKDFEINIKTNSYVSRSVNTAPQIIASPTPVVEQKQEQQTTNSQEEITKQDSNNYVTVKSPMIGTFYRKAGPDKPLLTSEGDSIEPGKILCIIEAMKLFNEIESEISGKIVKILVEDATPVEFDQPLFLVDPS